MVGGFCLNSETCGEGGPLQEWIRTEGAPSWAAPDSFQGGTSCRLGSGGILLVAAFFGVSWLYETWKEKAQEKGGTGAKVARVSDTIGRGIGVGLSGLQWIFVKVFGVVSVLVAVLLLYLLSITGFDFKILLGAVVLGGYGVYLLVPGERKWLFFWW